MKLILPFFISILLFTACKKEHTPANQECFDGFVIWGGDPAVDGAGWYLSSGSKSYFLEEFPTAYMTDSLPVHACVRQTDRAKFTMSMTTIYYYEIVSINKR
jgi:hypothetical protein